MAISKAKYQQTIVPELKKAMPSTNAMAIPKLEKVVINVGLGEALKDKKVVDKVVEQIGLITGQKPVVTKAKKAISTFKLRDGDIIGVKVTLRGKRMYDFVTRLVEIALPRVRDFRGIPGKGFDHQGNYTLGIAEQTIFPELEYGSVDRVRGFEATFVTTAATDADAKLMLQKLGLPFEK